MLRQCFLVSWSSINEDCTRNLHISCIFSIKFAVFPVYGKTSIQTKQCPVSFVRQFSILSDKNFQFVGLLSGNFSHDFAKTVHTKFCGNRSTGLGKEHFFKGFYHILAWQPSWSCDQHLTNRPGVIIIRCK